MNKLDMAHEYAMKHVQEGFDINYDVLVVEAWKYADAMQAEADKREVSIEEAMKDHVHDYIYGRVCACGKVKDVEEEWQPDWSQAPDNMTHFAVDANGSGWFFNREPYTESDCCWYCGDDSIELYNHNYQGNWQDSLRKRPQ